MAAINGPLAQLEALARSPALQVRPEQRPAIVAEILHHLMWPYFLNRRQAMQEKFDETQYRAYMRELADYCLCEYIEHPEPRLTLDFIKGLHRQFYGNADKAPVKILDGQMATMVPGEIRTIPAYIQISGAWKETLVPPEKILPELHGALMALDDQAVPIFERYLYFIFNFSLIHPFIDSNGKLSLVLGDLYLLKLGIHPPFFARYWMTSRPQSDNRIVQYALIEKRRDLSDLYPVILDLYAQTGAR